MNIGSRICPKTMMECASMGMCAPFGGCLAPMPGGDEKITNILTQKKPEKRARPQSGQFWHVRLQGATALITRIVTDITPLTIELAEDRYSLKTRYRRMDIEMVERVK